MTLKEKLKLVGITSGYSNYQFYSKLTKYIRSNPDSIIEFKQHSDTSGWNHTKLDISDSDTWSTYDRCFSSEFFIESNKLVCKVTVWNGDNFTGECLNLRLEVEFSLTDSFLKEIESLIENNFDFYLEMRYEEYLESLKQEWIQNLRKKLENK